MKIVTNKHPALHKASAYIKLGTDVTTLIEGMAEVLVRYPSGVGLAANQVGICQRVILISTRDFVGEIINPVIVKKSGKLKSSKEGCLSFPNAHVKMKRDNIITVLGYDRNWNPIKKKFRALTAFVVQHEIDHLNGINITDGK